jgi:hypothetical protein
MTEIHAQQTARGYAAKVRIEGGIVGIIDFDDSNQAALTALSIATGADWVQISKNLKETK